MMLGGKDRRKKGKVLRVLHSKQTDTVKVVVEGLNVVKHHERAKRKGQKGQIVSKERAVDRSSVQLICPSCKKPTRVGYRLEEGKGKVRVCRKCDKTL